MVVFNTSQLLNDLVNQEENIHMTHWVCGFFSLFRLFCFHACGLKCIRSAFLDFLDHKYHKNIVHLAFYQTQVIIIIIIYTNLILQCSRTSFDDMMIDCYRIRITSLLELHSRLKSENHSEDSL